MTGRAADGVLEVVVAAGGEVGALTDPGRIGDWLCSMATVRGERVESVVEEEYGYRRHLRWRILEHAANRRLCLRADLVEREWDGSDGTPVGPPSPAQRWQEPSVSGTTLEIVVAPDLARVRWHGFPPAARDDLRRQGSLLCHAAERAVAAGFARATDAVEVRLPISDRDWLGDAPLLVAQPGAAWQLEGAGGRVLLSVGDRRLVASCALPGSGQAECMLDVRVERQRGGSAALLGSLQLTAPVDERAARDWLCAAAARIAEGTDIEVRAT